MLFEASRARVNRAWTFIHELRLLCDAYAKDDPLSARIEASPDGLSVVLGWKGIGLLSGVVVGDCVHSLRAALDLMSSEMARLNGHSDKNVYFPFSEAVSGFDAAIRSKNFKKCGADAVALLATFEPYRGGNEYLRSLHDLDIQDKHKTLIPAHSTFDFAMNEELVVGGPPVVARLDVSKVILTFPPGGPVGGLPLVETLEEFVHLVERILEAFESLVVARPTKGAAR